MKMLSELEYSLDKEHIIIKDVICSFAKVGSLDGDKNSQYRLDGNLKKLQEIYENTNFRHKYSKIFLIISSIDKIEKTNSGNILSIDDLMHSMEMAHEHVSSHGEYENSFKKCFDKLYDHVVLEILQIKYMREIENKGEANNASTIKELKNATSLAQIASQNASRATNRLDNMQKEYITILGIFASIVFAFVAGLTFSTSVLSHIHQASIYRLSFIVCLIGLFITNILHYLYAFIREIHFSKINQDSEKQKECDVFWKSLKNGFCNSYIFRFNLFIVCIMCAIFVYWRFFDLNAKVRQSIENNHTNNSNIIIELNSTSKASTPIR
ncbi:hypothetical protein CCAL9344_08045 [Campylobacter sp. RM9344]|uniref:Uncharacterized protein n=1 Tax=Campylobacter californiensis TaxID=1032243 RepID=A0AAW3ZU07_9BACT|nr:hypothetical protein [Campylobacter sp. RM9337]MBE3030129.1 hypothetical protein [Campylobacter sp. RM9344]MBE3608752.1 hypothetical protein [Campylobacter sp. RM9337]